ncbi:FtsK/SpoIIIE domain-containing protein [Frankia sp. CiP1_Cm_nod2]|uniref:FtsK/SpoIIIE domain-containing protein n=1 Tax=Frankia sp. CiP1_Cm_nod2 TaxID=2897161 RepID=UPI002024761F
MASPVDVDAQLRSLVRELEANTRRLADARSDLKCAEKTWRHQADQMVAVTADQTGDALGWDRGRIETNAREAHTAALGVATRLLGRKAPSYLVAGWASDVWRQVPPPASGEWLRVGTATFEADTLPLVLPLSAGVWSVVGADANGFKALIQNTIARAVAAFDPPRLRVLAYDPVLALDLAAFAGLRAVSQASVPPTITSTEDFERTLDSLLTDLAAVHDRLTAAGQDTYWSALAAGHALASTIPFRLLVIGSATEHLTGRGIAQLDQLRRLAADQGLLIIESTSGRPPVSGTTTTTISLNGATATASTVPGISWTPDPWAGDRFIRMLSTALVDRPRGSLAPTVDFRKIVGAIQDPWMSEADEGLEAVIGTVDGRDLVLRLRSENPPMPNALIGGAVGQGKSNLLLVLIHSLAAKYSPAELEMVLVDLRDGVEFARLGPGADGATWLPHIRALGLEFDPDYCIGVLRWVRQQMTERSKLLTAHSATTLTKYHENTGKVIPRLLVVIDEFQRLFEGDDDQAAEAASLLESIARTGRGFGVHLVLASQAITGIRGLATKADAIFGQFHNRVTLRNTAGESQAFLAAHNLAATELEHRGQVVVNDALGALDANTIGTVAYADADYLRQLQARLFQRGYGAPPSTFRASSFAAWPRTSIPSVQNRVTAAVGLPIAIDATPRGVALTRAPNQGLAVVGTDRSVAIPVLVRAVTTAADSLGGNTRITVLDADGATEAPSAWVAALIEHLTRHGAAVERVGHDAIAAKVIELGQRKGTTDLVVALALDSVDLGTPTEADYLMPNDSLRELFKSGPLGGTWAIGWWQSMPVLEEHLGYRAPGIRAWAFCGVSRDDLTSICGHAVREPSASPRFVWFDRTGGPGAELLVPFAATDVLGTTDLG